MVANRRAVTEGANTVGTHVAAATRMLTGPGLDIPSATGADTHPGIARGVAIQTIAIEVATTEADYTSGTFIVRAAR